MILIAFLSLTILAAASAEESVDALRERGQRAVDELHAKLAKMPPRERMVLEMKLDSVCGQKDCYASRLFWFTDLEQAKAEAHRTGRPILSLHLLGRLDEELSCANSRFFRTLLYSDPAISALLREGFVLHWHTVREVPRVTIEVSSGRFIRQTIGGNSAHYLLDENGAPLDVLPGLYSPAAFRAQLEEWTELHRTLTPESLHAYHLRHVVEATQRATELGIDRTLYDGQQPVWVAQRQSVSKARTEVPLLRQIRTDGQRTDTRQVQVASQLAEAGKDAVQFSDRTLELMRTKQDITAEVLDTLKRTVASDTAFNEYDLHRRAHEWFVQGEVSDLHSLNERVYDELFLTPSSDPWLGLQPNSVFFGIAMPKEPAVGG